MKLTHLHVGVDYLTFEWGARFEKKNSCKAFTVNKGHATRMAMRKMHA